jgi:hypothetical protein
LELLEDEEDGYNGPEVITVPAVAAEPETAKTPAPGKGPVRSYTFALSPDSKVDLVFHGEITDDSLKALRDYVDITVRVLGGLKGEPKDPACGRHIEPANGTVIPCRHACIPETPS